MVDRERCATTEGIREVKRKPHLTPNGVPLCTGAACPSEWDCGQAITGPGRVCFPEVAAMAKRLKGLESAREDPDPPPVHTDPPTVDGWVVALAESEPRKVVVKRRGKSFASASITNGRFGVTDTDVPVHVVLQALNLYDHDALADVADGPCPGIEGTL